MGQGWGQGAWGLPGTLREPHGPAAPFAIFLSFGGSAEKQPGPQTETKSSCWAASGLHSSHPPPPTPAGAVTAVRLGPPEIGGGSSRQPRFSAPEPQSAHSDTGEDKRASPPRGAEPRRKRPRHVLAQEAHHAGESPSRTHNHGPARTAKRGRRPQTLHARSTGWKHPERPSRSGADTEGSCACGWAPAQGRHVAPRRAAPLCWTLPPGVNPVPTGAGAAPLLQPRGPTAKTRASPAGPLNPCPGWAQQGIAGSFLQGCPPRLRGRPQRRESGSPGKGWVPGHRVPPRLCDKVLPTPPTSPTA